MINGFMKNERQWNAQNPYGQYEEQRSSPEVENQSTELDSPYTYYQQGGSGSGNGQGTGGGTAQGGGDSTYHGDPSMAGNGINPETGFYFNTPEDIKKTNEMHPEWSGGQPAKPAFDPFGQVGHDGTFNGMTREQYRDAWMSSGVDSVQGAKDWLAKHGGKWISDNGTVLTPYGETLDMLGNAKGSAAGNGKAVTAWGGGGGGNPNAGNPNGNPGGNPTMPTTPAYTPQTYTPASPTSPNPATPTTPAEPAAQDPAIQELLDMLKKRATQSMEIDKSDPNFRQQADANAGAQNRARRNYQSEAAEKLAANGLGNSGALNNEYRFADEQAATGQGQFEAQLVGRELDARRQEIQQALTQMGDILTENQRVALQKQLAELDDATKRYGIDTQNGQYYAGLSQADRQFAEQLAQRDRLAQLDNSFRYAQLGQDDSHFNSQLGQNQSQFLDQMGFNTTQQQAYWDAVRRGLI